MSLEEAELQSASQAGASTSMTRATVEVLFESDVVRVLSITMPPGSRTKRIMYDKDYYTIPLTQGTVVRVVHEGDTIRRETQEMQIGATYLRPTGSTPMDCYLVNESLHEIRFQKVETLIRHIRFN